MNITKHGQEVTIQDEHWYEISESLKSDPKYKARIARLGTARRARAAAQGEVRAAEARFNNFGRASAAQLEAAKAAEAAYHEEVSTFRKWLDTADGATYHISESAQRRHDTARKMENDDFFRDGRLYA